MEVYAAGIGGKVVRITRGGLVRSRRRLPTPRGSGTNGKKSAEGIVGGLDPAEGRNMSDVEGSHDSDDEGETE
jgi:hypothetical protein